MDVLFYEIYKVYYFTWVFLTDNFFYKYVINYRR